MLVAMKLLILGGTAWLGHAVAQAAFDKGHDVTCVARGTAVPAGVTLVRADRDDDYALTAVTSSSWDAVVDVARQLGPVRRAARDLAAVAAHFVFVSSVSAYASQAELGADEDAPLLAPVTADATDPSDYGASKVACENALLGAFGPDRVSFVRPGLIGGPGDPTDRTGYWPLRFAHPSNPQGRVLVPDAPQLPTSVIDVRDLAAWIVHLVETRVTGVFNALGDVIPFPEHIEVARTVAGHDGKVLLAPQEWLTEQGVTQWSGPRSLPLWITDRDWWGMNARTNQRAIDAGLTLRPLAQTLADSLTWEAHRALDAPRKAGLSDDEELALLATLAAHNGT